MIGKWLNFLLLFKLAILEQFSGYASVYMLEQ